MSTGKNLKFQFSLDQASFAQVKTSIQQLVDLTAKLGKNLQGVGGAGSVGSLLGGITGGQQQSSARSSVRNAQRGPSSSGLSDVVRQNLDLFKGLGKEGAQSMNVLVDALKKATNQSQSELERQKRLVDSLAASYDRLKASGKDALAEKRMGQAVQAQAELEKRTEAHSQLVGAAPSTPGSGRPGSGPSAIETAGGAAGLRLAKGALAATIVGSVFAALEGGEAGKRMDFRNYNNRGALFGGQIDKIRGGNYGTIFGLQELNKQPEILESLLSPAERISAKRQGFFGDVGKAMSISKGGPGTNTAAGDGIDDRNVDLAVQERVFSAAEHASQNAEAQEKSRGLGYLQQTVSSRIAAAQLLGIKGTGPKGKGRTGDNFTDFSTQLDERGYSLGQHMGAVSQSRGMGMGGKFAGTIMSASAGGYSGVPEALHAAFVTSRGQNTLDAVKMAMGATKDYTVGLQLSNMANTYNGRNVMDQSGFLSAAQGPLDGKGNAAPMDQLALNRFNLGIRGMDAMATGRSGREQGMNLLAAVGAAPGLDTYAQDELASLDTQTLMNMAAGNLTDVQKAKGFTSAMAQKVLSSRAGVSLKTYVDQGGKTDVSKAMRAFKASGEVDPAVFAQKNPEFKAGLAGALTQTDPLGQLKEEGALGMLGFGPTTNRPKRGGIPGAGKIDELTGKLLKGQADVNRGDADDLVKHSRDIGDALGDTKKSVDIFKSTAGDITIGAEKMLAAFERVTTMLNKFSGFKEIKQTTSDKAAYKYDASRPKHIQQYDHSKDPSFGVAPK